MAKNLLSQCLMIRLCVVLLNLKVDEALHARDQGAVPDCSIVWMPCAVTGIMLALSCVALWDEDIQFIVVAGDTVVRVLKDRVKVLDDTGVVFRGLRLADVLWSVEGAVVDNVVQTGIVHATQDVVKGTIFQDDPHHVLDLALEIGDGDGRPRPVAERSTAILALSLRDGGVRSGLMVGAHGNRSTQGRAREADQSQQGVDLHGETESRQDKTRTKRRQP